MSTVFISGATGYLGRPLTQTLADAGHNVFALSRPQSIRKLPFGCTPIPGNALDVVSFFRSVPAHCTYIHLTGVSHPSPAKATQFRTVDQASFQASLQAARAARAHHFLYVSVAHPAPIMRAYVDVRRHCEQLLLNSGLNATILRPWYVLGPGHRWPYALVPLYKIAEIVPIWRLAALRLGLVTHAQMLAALVQAVGRPPSGVQFYDVAAIRAAASASPPVPSPIHHPSDLSA